MKKISLKSVSDILSDEQMKRQTGGKEGCVAIDCGGDVYYAASCDYGDLFCDGGFRCSSC